MKRTLPAALCGLLLSGCLAMAAASEELKDPMLAAGSHLEEGAAHNGLLVDEVGDDATPDLVAGSAGRSLLQRINYNWRRVSRIDNKYKGYARWAVNQVNKYPDVLRKIYGRYYVAGRYPTYYRLTRAYYYKSGSDQYYQLYVTVKYGGRNYAHRYYVYHPNYRTQRNPSYVYYITYQRKFWQGRW